MASNHPGWGRNCHTAVSDGGIDARGSNAATGSGAVLVIEDDEEFAETVELWLEGAWDVRVAFDGDEGVEAFSSDIDVVLLDRRMPRMPGDDALTKLREQPGAAGIAMMTAVDPGWEIAEMDYDMYLKKPVRQSEIRDAVAALHARVQYSPEIRTLLSVDSKIAWLRERFQADDLADSEQFQALTAQRNRLETELADELEAIDQAELDALRWNDGPAE